MRNTCSSIEFEQHLRAVVHNPNYAQQTQISLIHVLSLVNLSTTPIRLLNLALVRSVVAVYVSTSFSLTALRCIMLVTGKSGKVVTFQRVHFPTIQLAQIGRNP